MFDFSFLFFSIVEPSEKQPNEVGKRIRAEKFFPYFYFISWYLTKNFLKCAIRIFYFFQPTVNMLIPS